MKNFIIIAILLCLIGVAVFYIVKEKKKGNICVGCSSCEKCKAKEYCNKK